MCVCVGVRFSTSPSVKKNNRPTPFTKWLVPITKSPKGHYVAYLFLKILLVIYKTTYITWFPFEFFSHLLLRLVCESHVTSFYNEAMADNAQFQSTGSYEITCA